MAEGIARWIMNLKVAGSNPGMGETSFLKDSEEGEFLVGGIELKGAGIVTMK